MPFGNVPLVTVGTALVAFQHSLRVMLYVTPLKPVSSEDRSGKVQKFSVAQPFTTPFSFKGNLVPPIRGEEEEHADNCCTEKNGSDIIQSLNRTVSISIVGFFLLDTAL